MSLVTSHENMLQPFFFAGYDVSYIINLLHLIVIDRHERVRTQGFNGLNKLSDSMICVNRLLALSGCLEDILELIPAHTVAAYFQSETEDH